MLLASSYDQSKYFRAEDVREAKTLHIRTIDEQLVGQGLGQERKLVVWFSEDAHGLVLNRTNNRTIRGAYGDEVTGWIGKPIVIFPTEASFREDAIAGTRGSSAKESNAEVVLSCLGERELSGRVINTRLSLRKVRSGPQGEEFPFMLREVELGADEDGDPITTMVVDWTPAPGVDASTKRSDPWEAERRTDARQGMVMLKRVLMSVLAEKGATIQSVPGGPEVRAVDREIVREEFYVGTPADGTPKEKGEFRRKRFNRTLARAIELKLIGIREISDVTFIWLTTTQPGQGGEF